MKTLFFKELREHRVLGVLGLVFFIILFLYTSSQSHMTAREVVQNQSHSDSSLSRLQPLVTTDYMLHIGALCAFFGGVIGWMQIHSERHRDLWGYLIHRPVTPSLIFTAKVAAGLLIYAMGAGIPLLCFVLWVRQPGSIAAPFEWAMALPSAALFLAGIACYFAVMLIGLRAVRWHGSRILPLGAAVTSLTACGGMFDPSVTFIIIFLCVGILVLAAWGAFQTHGQYTGQPAAAKAALMTSLTIGISMVMMFVATFIFSALHSQNRHEWTAHQVGKDGTLYRSTRSANLFKVEDADGKPVLNNEGRPLEQEEFGKYLAFNYSCYVSTNKGQITWPPHNKFFRYWKGTPTALWYYWHRYDRLVGYDIGSRQIIGSIGPEGFSKELAGERFAGPGSRNYPPSSTHLHTEKAVYAVDVRGNSAQEIFKSDTSDPVMEISIIGLANMPDNVMVITKKAVRLLKVNGGEVASIPYEPGYPDYPQVSLALLEQTNHFVLSLDPDYQKNKQLAGKMPIHYFWFDRENGVTKKMERPSRDINEEVPTMIGVLMSVSMPPCFAILMISSENELNKFLPLVLAYALISTAIGFWLCRRHRLSSKEQILSLSFILATGLPGLIAHICARDWPTKEKCNVCGKQRNVEHEHCEHCQAPFPAPERNGVEIFETATAE